MQLDIEKEKAALEKMTAGQLADRYAELYGEATHSRHRTYLLRKILWKLQTLECGGLSDRAKQRAKELASDAELRVMPPSTIAPLQIVGTVSKVPVNRDLRLPLPGSSIVREYRGRKLEVRVLEDGFEFEGERYRSLSAVARKITGTHCNGFRFFNLEGGK
jgi:hypothetical protein